MDNIEFDNLKAVNADNGLTNNSGFEIESENRDSVNENEIEEIDFSTLHGEALLKFLRNKLEEEGEISLEYLKQFPNLFTNHSRSTLAAKVGGQEESSSFGYQKTLAQQSGKFPLRNPALEWWLGRKVGTGTGKTKPTELLGYVEFLKIGQKINKKTVTDEHMEKFLNELIKLVNIDLKIVLTYMLNPSKGRDFMQGCTNYKAEVSIHLCFINTIRKIPEMKSALRDYFDQYSKMRVELDTVLGMMDQLPDFKNKYYNKVMTLVNRYRLLTRGEVLVKFCKAHLKAENPDYDMSTEMSIEVAANHLKNFVREPENYSFSLGTTEDDLDEWFL